MVLTAPARVDSGRPALDRVLPVVTPEGAALELELAGLGARAAAASFDVVIAGIAIGVISLAGVDLRADPRPDFTAIGVDWADSALRTALRWLVPAVVAVVAVPMLQELAFGGRSLGKRAFRMRVVRLDGTRPPVAAIMLRNLLRPLDLLPGTYAVGAISLLVSKRAQRLGDIAAGTAVVRLRRALLVYGQVNLPPTPWQSMGPPTVDGQAIATARVDTRNWGLEGLTPEHREVLQAFAARRYGLPPAVRESFTAGSAACCAARSTACLTTSPTRCSSTSCCSVSPSPGRAPAEAAVSPQGVTRSSSTDWAGIAAGTVAGGVSVSAEVSSTTV